MVRKSIESQTQMKIRWLQQLPPPCLALPLSRKQLPLTRNLWAKSNVAAGIASVCSPKQGRKPVPNMNYSNTVSQAMAVLEWLCAEHRCTCPGRRDPWCRVRGLAGDSHHFSCPTFHRLFHESTPFSTTMKICMNKTLLGRKCL